MMAIFIPGMPCSLCGATMVASDDVIMFSPFVADRSDPLFVFSDATVHADCFARHPLSPQATMWHDEVVRHGRPTERICAACGKPILDPDDYFGTGLLSRDAAHALYRFNFIHLHRSHANQWREFDEFCQRVERAHATGAWQGPRLALATPPALPLRWVIA